MAYRSLQVCIGMSHLETARSRNTHIVNDLHKSLYCRCASVMKVIRLPCHPEPPDKMYEGWPGGHLYGSRLGNAGLSAFGTGPYRSFHETGGLLSVAVWTCQMLPHLHCSRLLSIFAPGIQNGEKTWKSEQKNPWGSISSQTFP